MTEKSDSNSKTSDELLANSRTPRQHVDAGSNGNTDSSHSEPFGKPGLSVEGPTESGSSVSSKKDAAWDVATDIWAGKEKLFANQDDEPATVISSKNSDIESSPDIRPTELGKQLIGTVLDHYRLDEFIGGGGMGAVFKGFDTLLGRTVAVKVLSRGRSDQDLIKRFVNEAKSAAQLDHDNIARVFFVGQSNSWNYIVFEFIEGRNIRQLVQDEGALKVGRALNYIAQIAVALDHFSKRKVIHRDIKPSNIIVTREGRAKLVDMGLARMHRMGPDEEELTASGMTLGTFDYVSPEQAKDPRHADVRSDIYSLGCTFYFMVTGLPPFPEGTPLQKLLSHSGAPRPNPQALRPDLPPEVNKIIRKCIDAEPANRYQTPADLLGEIAVVAAKYGYSLGLTQQIVVEAVRTPKSMLAGLAPILAPAILLGFVVIGIEFLFPATSESKQALIPNYASEASSQPNNPADSNSNSKQKSDSQQTSPPPQNSTKQAPTSEPEKSNPPGASKSNDEKKESAPTAIASDKSAKEASPPANASNSANSNLEKPVPVVSSPVRIRVVESSRANTAEEQFSTSLDDALQSWTKNPAIQEIVIDRSTVSLTQAFDIGDRTLTIIGGGTISPIITINSQLFMSGSCFSIRNGGLNFRQLHVILDSSSVNAATQNRPSLVRIDETTATSGDMMLRDKALVSLEKTTVTALTKSADNLSAILFRIVESTSGSSAPSNNSEFVVPQIRIRDSAFRGSLSLIESRESRPFDLSFEHGAFLSNGSMLVIQGSKERRRQRSISVDLRNIIVNAPVIATLQLTETSLFAPDLLFMSKSSVFELPTGGALVRQQLTGAISNRPAQAIWEGEKNLFPPATIAVETLADSRVLDSISLSDAEKDGTWFRQRLNDTVSRIPWERSRERNLTQSPSQWRLQDFQIAPTPDSSLIVREAGFNPSRVPNFPN